MILNSNAKWNALPTEFPPYRKQFRATSDSSGNGSSNSFFAHDRQSVSQRHSVVSYRAHLSKGHTPLPQQNFSYSLSTNIESSLKTKLSFEMHKWTNTISFKDNAANILWRDCECEREKSSKSSCVWWLDPLLQAYFVYYYAFAGSFISLAQCQTN